MTFLQLLFLSLTSFFLFTLPSVAVDTITPGQLFTDNGQTLVSSGENFELGFFTPWNSNNRYIGIWFKKIPQLTAYWVANKNNPLTNSSGVLTVTPTGNVVITDNRTRTVLWSSNSSLATVRNPVLKLLDTGNLVVADGETGDYLWQSFNYPCDTMIPGMKLGWDGERETWLTSWRSLEDASSGDYTFRIESSGMLEMILRQGTQVEFRSGPWDGVRFAGGAALRGNSVMKPILVNNSSGVYYTFVDISSTITRFVVNQTGLLEHLSWNPTRNQWIDMATMQEDNCDQFDHCGPNGICNINNEPECRCPNGFKPRIPHDWERSDWSGGCVQKIPLNCTERNGFKLLPRVKLPASSFLVNRTAMATVDCEAACLMNCSCTAYAKSDVSGCVVWFGDLLDVREDGGGGQDLFLRLDASELRSTGNGKRTEIIASVSVISGVFLLGLIGFLVWKRTSKRSKVLPDQRKYNPSQDYSKSNNEDDLELPLFDFATISTATNNFSPTNKIGEGGFGPVHKGVLLNGQEIAVKRLSKDSGQGLQEFKNEVILYLKLQHRNLVRLFGSCIDGEEKMLIYEYLPNKSLDQIIFNQTRATSLDWGKRYDIIVGIARGLLYLHRDSRLRIIHRDLKASNILLDNQMNPKISDFGLAKTFGGDQSEESTNRIIGTYGYMSPEYAIDGLFSMKSDVFSFGVLVLEIVSGKKNRGYVNPDHHHNLLGHAWKLWNEGKPMNLVDECIDGLVSASEVLRCIQMGLLCVQQRPEDRLTMSSVLLMLDSENPVLPQPKQPGFYTERSLDNGSSYTGKFSIATNEVTVTSIHGR